ncbi:NAD(P)-dependent dehydrogenase (short-subunit alcohol dehydrogenase family) [Spinactinospora alkalitolerans]|uniref:NAD(P)-dependent dehydrogenase (Short-subunit alcohol dehydrogenase family) n=1 Tax=Spinactinospora alkalitolerans TaxID=687207 RepID=A0A852U4P0_9ACTN|nr:NAD(P)-dependent dehydrogenase (short-subunit alcohol dehydrogenase family) [Spinactinospora alkalitolerans]
MVITGASSGIGREAARQFAGRGSSLVLAARSEQALRATADEVEQLGGTALVVPTDVAEWPQVQALAAAARDRFGRVDTWVNNAVLGSFGSLIDTPIQAVDRVLQVGLRGQIYGAKAVLPMMREQGGGTIIGVSSVLGIRSIPLYVPYCIAKHGNTALYEGLRVEEQIAGSGIEVTTILPATVNTPFYDAVPSFMDTRPPLIPPIYQPSAVAEAILYAAEHPRRRICIGAAGPMSACQRISPRAVDTVLRGAGRLFVRKRPQQPDAGQNNHFQPMSGSGATTGRARMAFPRSRYTRTVGFHPGMARTLAAVAALAVARRLWKR